MRLKGETEQWERECARARFLINKYFGNIEFIEETHQYFIRQADGSKVELGCVSDFTKQWDKYTDWDKVRENYAKKNGFTAEYWKEKWALNSSTACKNGTTVHEFAESCGWLSNGEADKICESARKQFNPETYEMVPCEEKEHWKVKDEEDDWKRWTRKQQAVVQFYKDLLSGKFAGLHFCMAETKVCTSVGPYSEKYNNNYCGTFDLLLYYQDPKDPEKSGFCIFDWKTNKDIHKDFQKSLLPPFSEYNEEPLSHYTMQLSCYQIPMEAIGLKVIARRLIWLKDEGGYELVPVEPVIDRIKDALRAPYIDFHKSHGADYNEEE